MASVLESIVAPDSDAIKTHLEALFAPCRDEYPQGLIELRYGSAAPNQSRFFNLRPDGVEEAAQWAASRNREGCNVYVGVNPRRPTTTHSANDGDVQISYWQFADLDDADAVDRVGKRLKALPPTMTVTTGYEPHRRPHFYWQLDDPVGNMPAWTERQRGIAHTLEGDAVINPSRIMRLAGTVNFPPQHKLAKGYRVELTSLRTVFNDDSERGPYSAEQIATAYPITRGPLESQATTAHHASGFMVGRTQIGDLLAACVSGDNWHNNMIRLVAHLASTGRTTAEIMALADHITLPGFTTDQTRADMHKALVGARVKWDLPEPVDAPIEHEEATRTQLDAPLEVADAFDFVESDIPVRPWLVPGALLSGYTHMLAAPGGSGKSLFTLQFAIALAAGMQWGGFTPRRRCRSLIVNVEDDIDEQRRRLAAAARVMGVEPQALRGWIYLVDGSQGIVVAGHDPVKRTLVMRPVATKLRQFIEANKIDVLWADPFAETFEGDENDNSEVKWAMKIWRDEIARPTKSAVYLVHHTVKYAANGAGDANMIRGAGAIVNSTRISCTLMPMTSEEADAIGVDQSERHLFVRYDDAKANQSLKTNSAKWFRKESVDLTNGTGLQQSDEVGALVPWSPPDAFEGLSVASIGMVLNKVEEGIIDADGVVTGVRYTASTRGGSKESGRWVGSLFMEFLGMKEAQAKKVIGTWIATGVLVEEVYYCPERRRDRSGLTAPRDKRPTTPDRG
jgi:hypothetical protein